MGLSVVLARALEQVCNEPPQPEHGAPVNLGGTYYCPSDASEMVTRTGQLPECSECGRVLPWRVVYDLIEKHPHA
jgi:hypothetical protein